MAKNSNIEWCDHTWNAWEGCTKVGPGCDHCYAETRNQRFHDGKHWGVGAPRLMRSDKYWAEPLEWNDSHPAFFAEHGRRQRVFCSSLADVFDNEAPEGQRERLWALIKSTPNLDWLILTKRIGNAKSMLPADWGDGYKNVWLMISVVNQEEADRDIVKLLQTPATIRGLSMEPLLGAVNLRHINDGKEVWEIDTLKAYTWEEEIEAWRDTEDDWEESLKDYYNLGGDNLPSGPTHQVIDWVIVGGESGQAARPMHPDWVESLRNQCKDAGVPFFFKQWGEWAPTSVVPGDQLMQKIGKKKSGCLLDSVEYKEFPVTALDQQYA